MVAVTDRHDWHDLTGFRRDLLVAAAEIERDGDAPYGLGIKRNLEEKYGEEVSYGRLYTNLNYLAEEGLVEKSELDARTNQYRVTSEGFDLLAVGRSELVAVVDGVSKSNRVHGNDHSGRMPAETVVADAVLREALGEQEMPGGGV